MSPTPCSVVRRAGADANNLQPDVKLERLMTTFGDQKVPVLSLPHLLQNKKAADRLQDRADVVVLKTLIEARRRQED